MTTNANTNANAIATSMLPAEQLSGLEVSLSLPLVWDEEMLGQGAGLQSIDLSNWDAEKQADFIRFFVGYGLRAATKSATAGKVDKRTARQERLDAILRGDWRTSKGSGKSSKGLAKEVAAGIKAWLMAEFRRRTGQDFKGSATTDLEKLLTSFAAQLLDVNVGPGKWGLQHLTGTKDKFRPALGEVQQRLEDQLKDASAQLPQVKSADDFVNSL